MKFSLFSVMECPAPRLPQEVYREVLDLFVYGEQLGIDGAWIAEHHFSDYGTVGGPAVFLAALAARTTTLDIGVAVSVLPFHDPLRIAEDYAVLDVISNGRLKFGVGRGYQPREFAGFHIGMGEARERFWESLAIIEQAWYQGRVDFAGKYYRHHDLPMRPSPVQNPVPTYIASVSPETFDLVREKSYHVCGALMTNSARQVSNAFRQHRDSLEPDRRWHIDLPIVTPLFVGKTMESAFRNSRPGFQWYWDTIGKLLPRPSEKIDPSYHHFERLGKKTMDGDMTRRLADWPIGDVEQVTEYLINLCRESTSRHIICFNNVGQNPYPAALESLELLAGEVIPRVKSALLEEPGQVDLAAADTRL